LLTNDFRFSEFLKNKLEIFKKAQELLDELEVQELLSYCDKLEDEIVDFKFEKEKSKEKVLLEIIREIKNSCSDIEKLQIEHERFGYEVPDYKTTIFNLKNYILERCKDERIYL
jgi:hypothetical protein